MYNMNDTETHLGLIMISLCRNTSIELCGVEQKVRNSKRTLLIWAILLILLTQLSWSPWLGCKEHQQALLNFTRLGQPPSCEEVRWRQDKIKIQVFGSLLDMAGQCVHLGDKHYSLGILNFLW